LSWQRLFPAGEDLMLSINFMPNAVYEPAACPRATLLAAGRCNFPPSSIMFEFTENEVVSDTTHLTNIITEYRKHGFTTAIDGFGAGHRHPPVPRILVCETSIRGPSAGTFRV
jgi:EAL domain-containing protein (putative c-di-GMP-specific phosphodiesterase class I)